MGRKTLQADNLWLQIWGSRRHPQALMEDEYQFFTEDLAPLKWRKTQWGSKSEHRFLGKAKQKWFWQPAWLCSLSEAEFFLVPYLEELDILWLSSGTLSIFSPLPITGNSIVGTTACKKDSNSFLFRAVRKHSCCPKYYRKIICIISLGGTLPVFDYIFLERLSQGEHHGFCLEAK